MGILFAQFVKKFGADALAFLAAAPWAAVIDHAHISAQGVTIKRMVDRAVAHAMVVHETDNTLKGFRIFAGIAIKLHIGDMACVGQLMVWSLNLDFFKCLDMAVHGHMEGIGVVIPVRNAGNAAELALVQRDKAAAEAFRRGG